MIAALVVGLLLVGAGIGVLWNKLCVVESLAWQTAKDLNLLAEALAKGFGALAKVEETVAANVAWLRSIEEKRVEVIEATEGVEDELREEIAKTLNSSNERLGSRVRAFEQRRAEAEARFLEPDATPETTDGSELAK